MSDPKLSVQQPSYRGVDSEACAPDVFQRITMDAQQTYEPAQFHAETSFYDVRYPYWQYPFNVPIFNVVAQQGAGTYHHQSNLGIVGRPRGINDWNTPLQTPYGVLPDELQ